jgi:hypothetical protein
LRGEHFLDHVHPEGSTMNTHPRFRSLPHLLLFIPLFIGSAQIAVAQISISSVDHLRAFAAGAQWKLMSSPGGQPQPFHLGAPSDVAQTWDFTSQLWSFTTVLLSVEPSTTPFFTAFPAANITELNPASPPGHEIFTYYELTPAELTILGSGTDGRSTTQKPPLLVRKFPCTLGMAWSAQSEPESPVPGITYTRGYSWTVDAFGTLKLPEIDVAVLRIRAVLTVTTETPSGSSHKREISYQFVSKDLAGAIVTIDTADDGRTDVNALGQYTLGPPTSAGSPPAAASGLDIGPAYPQPSAGLTRIPVQLRDGGMLRAVVTDALGRSVALLHDGPLVPGTRILTWNCADAAPGLYLCTVTCGGAARSLRLLRGF